MEMIQTEKLVYEYEKRDEEGNVIGTSRAIDEVDIEAKELCPRYAVSYTHLTLPTIA